MLLLLIEKCFNNAFKLSYKVFASSNVNEIIRAVLNSLIFFFFYKKILHAAKAQKHKDGTKQENKTLQANKNEKCAQKHLRGKKSHIRLFVFLCARRKENRKKRKVPTM